MSWCWFAWVDELPGHSPLVSAATVDEEGAPAGFLAAWEPTEHPVVAAAKIDARILDPDGGACRVSLVLAPPGVRVPFDDPAVAGARRAVLAREPQRAMSTLVRGDSIFAGAVTVLHEGDGAVRFDDPFARILPACVLDVGRGMFGRMSAPAGPVVERYGGGNPWPWDRFP